MLWEIKVRQSKGGGGSARGGDCGRSSGERVCGQRGQLGQSVRPPPPKVEAFLTC